MLGRGGVIAEQEPSASALARVRADLAATFVDEPVRPTTGALDVLDALDGLEAAVDRLAVSPPADDVVRLLHLRERLDAQVVRAVGAFSARGGFAPSHLTMPAYLRHRARIDGGVAARMVELAAKLAHLPATAAAFAAGEISRAHAEVIARASTPERREAIRAIEAALVDLARREAPAALRPVVQYVTDAIDADDGAGRDEAQRQRRRFHLSQTLDGMWKGDFLVDDLTGREIKAVIDRRVTADLANEPGRSPAQRRADALADAFHLAADALADSTRAQRSRPHLMAVVDVREIAQWAGADRGPDLAERIRGEAKTGGGLSRTTLDMLACDCSLHRVITDGPSEVLDLGRTCRTASPAQRSALVVRDGGCVEPGCDRGADWCDAHHVDPYEPHGRTDIDNLELRCRPHHHLAHRRLVGPRRAPARPCDAILADDHGGTDARAGPDPP